MKTLKIFMVLTLISSLLTVGIIVSENVSASAVEIPVSPGSGTITAALVAAQNGDSLILSSGDYYDNVDVNKRVTIVSETENPDDVKVFPSDTNLPVFDINIDSVELSHMTIQGTSEVTPSEYGVRSDVTAREHYDVLLEDLKISLFKIGIKICRTNTGLSYPTTHDILECTIYHNNKGVYIEADPEPGPTGSTCTVIDDCNIFENTYYNSFSNYYGVEIHGDLNYIRNSDIYGHQQSQDGIGVILINADHNCIYGLGEDEYTDITYNDVGLYFDNSKFNYIEQCNIQNNVATGYDQNLDVNLIYIDSGSNSNEITDCTITTNHEDDISRIIFEDSDSNTLNSITFDGYISLNDDSDLNSFTNVDDIIGISMNGHSDANSFSYCTVTGYYNGGYITAIFILSCDNIGDSKIIFDHCDIEGNYGFYIYDGSGISITNCDLDTELYAVFITYNSANILVQYCDIACADTGFQIENSYNVMIYDDTFASGMVGFIAFYNGQIKIKNSVFYDIDENVDMFAFSDTSNTFRWYNLYLDGVGVTDPADDFDWYGSSYVTFTEDPNL